MTKSKVPQKATPPPSLKEKKRNPFEYQCNDDSGSPHFGATPEEASSKASESNRALGFKYDRD